MTRTFKDKTLADCYSVARKLGADNFSEFHYGIGETGPRWPRRGAGHRNAYWNGRMGGPCRYARTWPAYAFWAAGVDDRKADLKTGPGVPMRDFGRSITTTAP